MAPCEMAPSVLEERKSREFLERAPRCKVDRLFLRPRFPRSNRQQLILRACGQEILITLRPRRREILSAAPEVYKILTEISSFLRTL